MSNVLDVLIIAFIFALMFCSIFEAVRRDNDDDHRGHE